MSFPGAVVVDLDPGGPRYQGERSLRDLIEDGVRRPDLTPGEGVAVLRNGGVGSQGAGRVIEALIEHHPRVVLRLPPRPAPEVSPVPVVPVRLLLPGNWFGEAGGPAVFQATPAFARMTAEGVRLPVPAPGTIAALLTGRRPAKGDRWIKAWRRVWGFSWGR